MKRKRGAAAVLAFIFLLSLRGTGCLEEPALSEDAGPQDGIKSRRVTKTVEGLNFDVEEDRPIEKVDGTYRPVAIDTYVAIKFQKLEIQIDKRLTALEERLKKLEAAVERLEKSSPSTSPAEAGPAAETPPAAPPTP